MTFVDKIKELRKTRELFATWITSNNPDGLKQFVAMHEYQQIGFLLAFLAKNNIGVNAYNSMYDIWALDRNLVPGAVKPAEGFLYSLIEEEIFYHHGIEHINNLGYMKNLILGITDALTILEYYE